MKNAVAFGGLDLEELHALEAELAFERLTEPLVMVGEFLGVTTGGSREHDPEQLILSSRPVKEQGAHPLETPSLTLRPCSLSPVLRFNSFCSNTCSTLVITIK